MKDEDGNDENAEDDDDGAATKMQAIDI